MHAQRTITLSDGNWTKKMRFTPGTGDQFVIKEVLIDECYAFDFQPSDVVLNLWGNIGAFDVFAFDRVKEIVTFEPDIKAYEELIWHLRENRIGNVFAYNMAVSTYTWDIPILIGNESGHNTCVVNWDEEWIMRVNCMSISTLLEKYHFTKIKCDIEGYEYELFQDIVIPESVNEMWLETHTFSPEQMKEHVALMDNFKSQWFRVDEIRNDEYNRTYLLHCKR